MSGAADSADSAGSADNRAPGAGGAPDVVRARLAAAHREGWGRVLAARLRSYPYLPAARGELLRRLGRDDEAAAELRRAIALQPGAAERRGLERRLGALGVSGGGR